MTSKVATRGRSGAEVALETSVTEQLVDDVTQIVQRAPFICRVPSRFFSRGLASELADAADRLNCKVAELRELEDAGR